MAKLSTQRGQTLVEYLLALSSLTLAATLGLRFFGPALQRAWTGLAYYFALPSP
jgi:type II secretory pathway component PulJ